MYSMLLSPFSHVAAWGWWLSGGASDGMLLGFGFGTPVMLLWLAAAALPIIIHLLNRRKHRETRWAAMEFLLAAVRKNSRRIRIEQWLLLAVRTLIVALTVFAMAQPFFDSLGMGMLSGERTLKIFVLDGSYSMALRPAERSRFDRAKELIEQIVEDSPQGDGFGLVLMAAPATTVIGQPSIDKRAFIDELINLELPHGGGDLSGALTQVEKVLSRAKSQEYPRSEVFFVTDLGRTSWGSDQQTDDFAQRAGKLSQQASLVVLDVGQGSLENAAVTRLAQSEPYLTLDRDVTITAEAQNFGTQPRLQQTVELYVDGRRMYDTLVDLPPGEKATFAFRHRFTEPGDHLLEARLSPDLLQLDNHRWLAVRVQPQVRVLVVDGKPSGDPRSGAAYFVAVALDPTSDRATSPSPIRADVVAESALVERDLATYDAIFLCNVGQFTKNEARLLANYVRGGGGLVMFLGDRVQVDRYNEELGSQSSLGLLPADLGDVAVESQYRFDPLGYRHPLVTLFQGREQAGLLTTPVYRYFQLTPREAAKATVAVAFGSGDPAIIDAPFGQGRILLVATDGSLSSVDPQTNTPWATMAAWPSFVPLVQEMLAVVVSGKAAAQNVLVGEPLGEIVPSGFARQSLQMELPGGETNTMRLKTDDTGTHWRFTNTRLSGPYRVLQPSDTKDTTDDQPSDTRLFAVNLDTRESNLARIDASELPAHFSTALATSAEETRTTQISRPSSLHRWLLYAVLVLLFVEVFLTKRGAQARGI
jgi:hypothetical protein